MNNDTSPRPSRIRQGCVSVFGIIIALAIAGGIAFFALSPSSPLNWIWGANDRPYSGYYYYLDDYYYYSDGTWYIYDDYYGWLRTTPSRSLRENYRDYYSGSAYENGYGAQDFYDGDYYDYGYYGDYYDRIVEFLR